MPSVACCKAVHERQQCQEAQPGGSPESAPTRCPAAESAWPPALEAGQTDSERERRLLDCCEAGCVQLGQSRQQAHLFVTTPFLGVFAVQVGHPHTGRGRVFAAAGGRRRRLLIGGRRGSGGCSRSALSGLILTGPWRC